jgi:NTE family protein
LGAKMLGAKRSTIALALGGGGARGYAHIGAIHELEKQGYQITAISGTSMGAVIGALYSAGKLSEFEKWARKLTRLDVVGLMDFSIGKAGAIRAERIFDVIDEMLADIRLEDLSIPMTVVATDLMANREVLFTSGPAVLALRASVAIPGVITPVMIEGRLLGDGGLVSPVPVSALKKQRGAKLVAIDLAQGRIQNLFEKEISEHFLKRTVTDTVAASKQVAAEVVSRPASRKIAKQLGMDTTIQQIVKPKESPLQKILGDVPKAISSADVISLSIQSMQKKLTRIEFEKHRPDLVIGIPMDACGILEFDRAKEMIQLGQKNALQAMISAGWKLQSD